MSVQSINLIPASTRRRQATRRATRLFSIWVSTAGIAVAAVLAIEWGRGLASARELSAIHSRAQPLVQLRQEHDELAAEIATLRERERLSLRLSRDVHGFTLLAALATSAERSGAVVYISELEYLGASATGDASSVRLTGAGIDSSAVASFASELRASGVFQSISVESTHPLRNGPPTLREFEIAGAL